MKQDNLSIAKQYANDVLNKKIKTCIYTKQAAQRFLDDLENIDFYYIPDTVDIFVDFVYQFDLTERDEKIKTVLQPWQIFIVANLYGLYTIENKRKYSYSYIEVARGNTKTQLISFFELFELFYGNDSQVIYAANTTKQVMEVGFDKLKKLCLQIDSTGKKFIRILYNKIIYNNNKLITTSNESKPIDGLSGKLMAIDEFHEMKNLAVYNVLKSSMAKRIDGNNLLFIITTAGDNQESECYKMRNYCLEILNKTKIDNSQFCIIYTLDEHDDFTDESNWIKSNPMIDISVNRDVIRKDVVKCLNNENEKNGVLIKNFNVWLKGNSEDIFLQDNFIKNSMKKLDIEDFKGCDCVAGVDLSSVSDTSAVAYLFVKDDTYYFFNDIYIPEYSINTILTKNKFREWAQGGYMRITEGNVIDYDKIAKNILDWHNVNNINHIYYDKHNATQWAINMTSAGFYLTPFSQLPGNLNAFVKEFERLIKSNKIFINNNPVVSWMLSNCLLIIDKRGNYSLDKSKISNKIDSPAAMINALAAYLQNYSSGFNII